MAASLELARVLAPYHFRHSIILAATGMEELDWFGAKVLVQPTDIPEKLDYDRLAAIVGATAVAIAQAAGY